MTTVETGGLPAVIPKSPGILAAVWRAMLRHRQQRARQLTLIQLSHYDARRLRDIGIDPRDVAEALRSRRYSLLFDPLQRNDRW